jgi:GT2 family glycosyltransferase
VGPLVLYRSDPERVWAAGGRLTWRQNLTTLLGQGDSDSDRWRGTFEVDYLTGCALLVRREVFEHVGAFDEAFFAYSEDVDLGLRAGRAGFSSLLVGAASALHEPSSSTGGGYSPRRKYMMGVNSVWFLRRWGGPREWSRFVMFDLVPAAGAVAARACARDLARRVRQSARDLGRTARPACDGRAARARRVLALVTGLASAARRRRASRRPRAGLARGEPSSRALFVRSKSMHS